MGVSEKTKKEKAEVIEECDGYSNRYPDRKTNFAS